MDIVEQLNQRLRMLSAMGLIAPSRRAEVAARLGDILRRKHAGEITSATAIYECQRDGIEAEAAMVGRLEKVLRSGRLDLLSWLNRQELSAELLGETSCPHCQRMVNASMGSGERDKQQEAFALCAGCGGMSVMSLDGKLRAFGDDDWNKLSTAERAIIAAMSKSVRENPVGI